MENKIKLTDKVTESGRRVLEIVLGKTAFQLRFTVGSQMRLKKEFKDEPLDIVMSAVQDTEKFIAIVNEALSWNGNTNPEDINGEQFYDLLVDNGVCGMNELAGVLFSIASVSGLFSEKQMNSLKDGFNQVFDKMFEQITDSERIEKVVSEDRESSFREAE